jgi:dGTPase
VRIEPKLLVAFSEPAREEHVELMMFLREHVYRHYKVLRMTSKARRVLKGLFDAFLGDVNLMPSEHRDIAVALEKQRGTEGRARAVADYIAGMTDRFAILEHSRLYDATERT